MAEGSFKGYNTDLVGFLNQYVGINRGTEMEGGEMVMEIKGTGGENYVNIFGKKCKHMCWMSGPITCGGFTVHRKFA